MAEGGGSFGTTRLGETLSNYTARRARLELDKEERDRKLMPPPPLPLVGGAVGRGQQQQHHATQTRVWNQQVEEMERFRKCQRRDQWDVHYDEMEAANFEEGGETRAPPPPAPPGAWTGAGDSSRTGGEHPGGRKKGRGSQLRRNIRRAGSSCGTGTGTGTGGSSTAASSSGPRGSASAPFAKPPPKPKPPGYPPPPPAGTLIYPPGYPYNVPAELGIWGHLPRRRTPSETAWTGTGGDREADTGAGILGLLAEDEEEEKESEKESAQVAGITSHFTPVESSADQDRINALEKKLKDQAEQLASLKKGLDERKEKEEEKWDDEKRKEAQEAAETEAAEQEAKAAAERARRLGWVRDGYPGPPPGAGPGPKAPFPRGPWVKP
jgi:hypothetical protein